MKETMSTMDISDSRITVRLELVPASSKKVLDGSEIFLTNIKVLPELFSAMCES
jgi:hypothetical protein